MKIFLQANPANVNICKLGGGKIARPVLLCNDVTRYKQI